jgi:hypothetical protein
MTAAMLQKKSKSLLASRRFCATKHFCMQLKTTTHLLDGSVKMKVQPTSHDNPRNRRFSINQAEKGNGSTRRKSQLNVVCAHSHPLVMVL